MARFSEVLTIINGKNQSKVENPNGRYPIYGSGGIMGYADSYLCKANTVIIGRKGSINNPIFVDKPFWNVDTAFGLEANTDVLLPKYLYYFCKAYNFEKLNTTVTIPSLTKANLLNIDIPLPSLMEQKAIVTRLNKVDELISLRKKQLQKLDDLVKSRFVEMFDAGSPSKCKMYIHDYADVISGFAFSSEDFCENEIPIVRISNINNGKVSLDSSICFPRDFWESNGRYRVLQGDVLMAMSGATTGKAGINTYSGPLLLNQRVACIRAKQMVSTSKFLFVATQLPWMYNLIQEASAGCAQPNISGKQIENMPIPAADYEKQKEFSVFANQIENLKLTVQPGLDKLELLKQSLMQKYFG